MPIVKNDANINFGIPNITLDGDAYYAESLSADENSTTVTVPDGVGSIRAQVTVTGMKTGQLSLQTVSGSVLAVGTEFTMPLALGISGSTFTAYISDVSNARSNSSYATVNVTWRELLN
jgi:hypothetical protein